ncbi:MAG: GMC family oxidoreductase [Rhodospirillales bacterium]|nr:GMC family oxidoreductase [Rhodospirillales bacterium]
MLLDARTIPEGTLIEADLCIIGAGAAGITIAREFIGQPLRVCVLESGGLRMQREVQKLYEGECVGLPYELDTTRTRFLGGSTNCWGGFSRPFEDFHFERREWITDSGWPICADDLAPYYPRVHDVCGIATDGFDADQILPAIEGHDLRPLALPKDRLVTRLSRLSKERRCFGKSYREELKQAPNVSVYLHANAVELLANEAASAVTGVRVGTLTGKRWRIEARTFVLATGAIENARLLLASNSTEACGLGNRNDMVGRYFMEHPRSVVAEVELLADAEQAMRAYLPRYAMLRLPVAAEMNIAPSVQNEERLLDAAAYLELVLHGEEAASTTALKQIYWDVWRGARPREPLKQIAAILSSPIDLATFGWGVFSCSERFIRCRRITLIAEQAPNPDSRVMLSHLRDRLGMNRVRLDWRLTEQDHRSVQRTAEIVTGELERAGLLKVKTLMPEWESDVLAPKWNWHHMGTTRMHEEARCGVVDRDCKVHGIDNLYIAGSSVFPTAGNHTPTFTILALALRITDRIRSRMKLPPLRLVHQRERVPADFEFGNAAAARSYAARTPLSKGAMRGV